MRVRDDGAGDNGTVYRLRFPPVRNDTRRPATDETSGMQVVGCKKGSEPQFAAWCHRFGNAWPKQGTHGLPQVLASVCASFELATSDWNSDYQGMPKSTPQAVCLAVPLPISLSASWQGLRIMPYD